MDPNLLAILTLAFNIIHTRMATSRIERDGREERIRYQERTKARVDFMEKEIESLKIDRREMFSTLDGIRESIAGFASTLKHIENSLQQLQQQHTGESK